MRIGLLGGTFDPVHVGHIVVAVEARHALELDVMLLVVAASPWQKEGRVVASAPDRFDLVAACVEGIEGVEASAAELGRDGPTYTVDTLRAFAEQQPGAELFLVVGSDVARRVDTWREPDEVRRLATLVGVRRGGDTAGLPAAMLAIDVPALEVSSTDVRERLATGRPIDGLVPPAGVRLIAERHLYP